MSGVPSVVVNNHCLNRFIFMPFFSLDCFLLARIDRDFAKVVS